MKAVLIIWILLLTLVASAAENSAPAKTSGLCNTTLKIVASFKTPVRLGIKIPKEIGHTLYFPYVKGAQILREGWGIFWKHPGRSWSALANRIWNKDKWRAGIFSVLLALDYQTTVNYREYEKATRSFEDAKPNGQSVVVDSFKADDWLYPKAGKYLYKRKFAKTGAILLEPETSTSTYVSTDRFMDLVRKNGMMSKLDIYEHNLPGGAPGPTLEKNNLGYKADEKTPYSPNDVFAPGAQVRFNSCFTGNGPEGREFLARFEELFLSKGGTVYAPELQITANPVEYLNLRFDTLEAPGWLRDLAQPARTPLGLWTASEIAINGREWKMEFPVRNRILIHQVLPKEKAWAGAELTSQLNILDREFDHFDDMNYQGDTYKEAIISKFRELPDPLDPSKKLSETHAWKTFSHPFAYAIVTAMDPESAPKFVDAFNSGKFPYLKASQSIASYAPYVPGIHLDLKQPPKEELKEYLFEVRKKANLFLDSMGSEGSKQEQYWALKAETDANLRIQNGMLPESERKLFLAQALRKLIFLRSEGRRVIQRVDDVLKYRSSLQ